MSTTLQPLRDAIKAREVQRKDVINALREGQAKVELLNAEIQELHRNLREGRALELAVTDHAILRYAERVLEFDRNEVVNLIRERVAPKAFILGDGKFPVALGFNAVVKQGTVVTIEPA